MSEAAPEAREVLETAYNRIFCRDTLAGFICEPCDRLNRFTRFLDAEAYTDAALLLVPDGCKWAVTSRNSACCNPDHIAPLDWVFAATPALAIAAAALRAKGPGHE